MRIAIVNDLAIAVEALRRVVRSVADAEVAWVARDGAEAIEACARERPDLVLMDLIMPKVDGVEATREIMRRTPCPVLVVTASVRGNVAKVYEALGHGALDAVATPRLGIGGKLDGGAELIRKIETVRALAHERSGATVEIPLSPAPASNASGIPPLVAIGASTGGPAALATVLGSLPAELPAAIAVVQHIDVAFAAGLARWLARRTQLTVAPLGRTEPLRRGHVWVAAAAGHLILRDDFRLGITNEPEGLLHTPSIDVFFESASRRVRSGCGVLLTGMGRDGARGLLALRKAGFHTIAQDEASSIVWGMPRAAAERGAAVEVQPLHAIAKRIVDHVAALAQESGKERAR